MTTCHNFITGDARHLELISRDSMDLIVTSPPYPMIAMWDELFTGLDPAVEEALMQGAGPRAFELMHRQLDYCWDEIFRVLKPGGMACINIGDATRTINNNFHLFPNHARILSYCQKKGFNPLPAIIWRKETNAPNKFMGSGMLPPGAYVTLEHEYILLLRQGGKREFNCPDEKQKRRESAFFWEERNKWFSDVWSQLKGARQTINNKKVARRSGAFPFELAYRLINMFSIKGDRVLDPFSGTGTVMLAAISSERNSTGVDLNPALGEMTRDRAFLFLQEGNNYLLRRLQHHLDFIRAREKEGQPIKYRNKHHGFPVITRQEEEIKINLIEGIQPQERFPVTVSYRPLGL